MDEQRPIARWIGIIGCYGVGAYFIRRVVAGTEPSEVLGFVIATIVALLAGTALLAPDLIRLVGRFVDQLYFPDGKPEKPVLSYKLPTFYRKEERYEEALEQYDIILKHYPQEVRAWIGAIEVLVIDFNAREQARHYYERGLRKLRRDRVAREQLEQCWRSLCASPVAS